MTKEEKPPTGATVNGLNIEYIDKQRTESSESTADGQSKKDKVTEVVLLIAKHWPDKSIQLKAATALANVLLREGWREAQTQQFIESVMKSAGGNLSISSQATKFAAEKIKDGKPVFGWPKLSEFTSDEIVEPLRELLGIKANSGNKSKSGFVILENPPTVLRKPLALIEGRAYAASWLHVQFTLTETTDEDGKITRHNPPLVKTQRRLLIIREEGTVFNNDNLSLSELGFSVSLFEIPQAERLWSSKGFQNYSNGERADAKTVFKQLCEVIDAFIDFDKSTASQKVMCEFMACYILATWFLDAFNVIGFIWPNGERGSGKTQLLTLISQLGYLGQLILAGSSFASLRDLADYGATLCFDDAESISDPRKQDGDKRTLLLAGNKRGSSVTLKEKDSEGKWRTKYVNTYCARVFSAIALPDAVLASRTIIVPLVRTSDKTKANNDPQDFKLWPHDFRKLVDDLWALALANLKELPAYETKVNDLSALKGRALEPWKAILSVACWLEDRGVTELWEGMNQLSLNYQSERQGFETEDVTTLLIESLCNLIGCEVVKLCEVSEVNFDTPKVFVLTSEIECEAVKIIEERDLDIDQEEVSSRKLGKKLAQLRFKKHREGGSGKSGWYVSQRELVFWVKALGMDVAKVD